MLFKFDSEVSEFLSFLKPGARNVHGRVLATFKNFTRAD